MGDVAALNIQGFTGTCSIVQSSASVTFIPALYGEDHCRMFPHASGQEESITCDAVPTNSFRRFCACRQAPCMSDADCEYKAKCDSGFCRDRYTYAPNKLATCPEGYAIILDAAGCELAAS